MEPWNDWLGTLVAALVGLLLAWAFWRQGRPSYRTGFYASLGYVLISIGQFLAEGEARFPMLGVIFFPAVAATAYFAGLGVLVAFGPEKSVRCFRCEYVGYASETDEPYTPMNDEEFKRFRNLSAELRKHRMSESQG